MFDDFVDLLGDGGGGGVRDLEDGDPWIGDRAVDFVDRVGHSLLDVGIGDRTDDSLQAHAGGEQPLDDDVVHVSRDSFSVVEDSNARFVASYTSLDGQ